MTCSVTNLNRDKKVSWQKNMFASAVSEVDQLTERPMLGIAAAERYTYPEILPRPSPTGG